MNNKNNEMLATDWMAVPAIDIHQSSTDFQNVDAYYEFTARKYWWKNADRYISGGLKQLRRYLDRIGYSSIPLSENSPSMADLAIQYIEHNCAVDLALVLAGKRAGRYELNGQEVLCTRSAKLVQPIEGDFPTIEVIVKGLLKTPEQVDVFYGWAHVAVQALYSGPPRRGQALVLAGPRACGKTLLLEIITRILGGASAEPYSYLLGNTDFNAEMFSCVHQILDDEAASGDPRKKKELGTRIKKMVATSKQRFHGKGQLAQRLPVLWRLSIALNDDPEALRVLPELDEQNRDKFIILKAHAFPLPIDTCTADGEDLLSRAIDRELPAFIHFLLQGYEIPARLRGGRFRITHYHNPEILEMLEGECPADQLQLLIDHAIFAPSPFLRTNPKIWKGPAAILNATLAQKQPAWAKSILWNSHVCGMLLGVLSRRSNARVEHGSEIRGTKQWVLHAPPVEAGTEAPSQFTGDAIQGCTRDDLSCETLRNFKF